MNFKDLHDWFKCIKDIILLFIIFKVLGGVFSIFDIVLIFIRIILHPGRFPVKIDNLITNTLTSIKYFIIIGAGIKIKHKGLKIYPISVFFSIILLFLDCLRVLFKDYSNLDSIYSIYLEFEPVFIYLFFIIGYFIISRIRNRKPKKRRPLG